MDIAKTVKKYGKIYRRILVIGNYPDPYVKQEAYEKRLTEMYASEKYAEHNIYPSTNTEYIYAIIAMCLELKGLGLSDKEIIDKINRGLSLRRNLFKNLIRCLRISSDALICSLTAIRLRKNGIYQITLSVCRMEAFTMTYLRYQTAK